MGFGSHILLRRRQTSHVMLCFDLKHFTHDLGGGVLVLSDVRRVEARDLSRQLVFFSEVRGHTGMNADNLAISPFAGGLRQVHPRELSAKEFFDGAGNAQADKVENELLADEEISLEDIRTTEAYLDFLAEALSHIRLSADNIVIRTSLQDQPGIANLDAAPPFVQTQALLLYEVSRQELTENASIGPVEISELQMPVAIVNPLIVHRYEKLDIGAELEAAASVNIPTVLVMNFDQVLTDMTLTEGEREEATPGTSSSANISDVTPTDIGANHQMETSIDSEIFSGPQTHLQLQERTPISIELRWDDKSREDLLGYHVYVDDVQHNGSIITGTSYTVMGLTQEIEYEFKVIVVYQDGLSPFSNTIVASLVDVTSPAAPTGLTGFGNWLDMQVQLDWDDNTEEDLAGYNVYANGAKVNDGLIGESEYTFDAEDEVPYEIFVTAVDSSPQANESDASAAIIKLADNPIDGPEDYLPELTGVCSIPRYESVVLDFGDACADITAPPTGVKSIPHNEEITLIWNKH